MGMRIELDDVVRLVDPFSELFGAFEQGGLRVASGDAVDRRLCSAGELTLHSSVDTPEMRLLGNMDDFRHRSTLFPAAVLSSAGLAPPAQHRSSCGKQDLNEQHLNAVTVVAAPVLRVNPGSGS